MKHIIPKLYFFFKKRTCILVPSNERRETTKCKKQTSDGKDGRRPFRRCATEREGKRYGIDAACVYNRGSVGTARIDTLYTGCAAPLAFGGVVRCVKRKGEI